MSQIVRRRKKGRPSKADLARRASSGDGYELRRSLRRRNVRYNFDFDDYLDDEDEAEEESRRGKKMKLVPVLKLNQSRASADPPTRGRGRPASRGGHVSDDGDEDEAEGDDDGEEENDDEEVGEKKPVKKRKISGGAEEDEDYEEEEEEKEDRGDADEDDHEERKGKETGNRGSSCPGTLTDISSETPMPDKKSLELILEKLQKKDIYGVYAEPVDPEELPDYHDIIEHPMDFATVRKKLANGSYSILEEFESDVFLICSNAMQYNASDTVYYKQARTIQEMAKKKFEKIRIKIERAEEKELKTEQKVKPGSSGKKQVKQFPNKNVLEPIGSDFSAGANLATGGIFQNGSVSAQTGTDGLLEGNVSLVDSLEKAEDLISGKGLSGKFGRKQSATEDNRHATYSMSCQWSERPESVFSTFEDEIKQLVAVGLHAEHAYARSLARFTATLGPVAWKVASQRIEQALPAGVKFGHGWVGEYEPLPTPLLSLETSTLKESSAFTTRNEMPLKTPREQPPNEPIPEGKPSLFQTSAGSVSEGKPLSSVASRAVKPKSASQQQNMPARASVELQRKKLQQVELNLPPPDEQTNAAYVSEKQNLDKSDTVAFRSTDMMRNVSLTRTEQYKPQATNGVSPGGLANGKSSTGLNSRMIDLSKIDTPNQMARAATCSQPVRPGQLQGLGDPSQLMKGLGEKAKMQHSSSHPQDNTHSFPSIRGEDSSNAALLAARAWMSIGSGGGGHKQKTENSNSPKNRISAESLYDPARELHPQALTPRGSELPFSQSNGFPFQTFVHQPVHGSRQQMGFPHMVPASDFNGFHAQSPWRGISTSQLKQRQDNLPPDLNIGVHSPDSPAKQSSGVRVDSQQPDLALQL
ncbi:PREDICTED: bromodomain and WD repeat-containing protein 1 [Tarenaya hassleriana]|uniref:bromodomain and WD repeat-containing protein 1 n=1 Tax=Tarenaya hassleriana TaxID=28532 RepID=UPI00053C781D|nr:PREDICTED: bromodomain and WD repeat-containing protein 1 [Tarenaya hassleriana]